MLKKVRISNFYSIFDEIEVDFTKGNYAYRKEMIFENNLVNPIGIYGLNGSGKTTLLKAIYLVSKLMYKSSNSDDEVLFIPYLLRSINSEEDLTVKICFEIIIENTNYQYDIDVNIAQGIMFERLVNLDNNYEYFTRDVKQYVYGEITKEIEGKFYPILRLLGKDILTENNELTKIFDFFENIIFVNSNGLIYGDLLEKNKVIDLVVKHSNDIKNIIKNYGNFPVYDVQMKRNNEDLTQQAVFKMEDSNISLPYIFASDGIQTHNQLLALLMELPKHSLILVDEIEHNLHPLIAQKVIEQMNELGIQMIFTSHNTNLLQKMRPDQIVFANWKNNKSQYNKLSKIYPNIREINNIEKMYFGGMFDDE